MAEILIPGLILGAFAFVSAGGLLIASKKFYVYEDPRIDQVEALLPGANCGGCGFAGCRAYAEHAVNDMKLEPPCPVASVEQMNQIAQLLNLEIASEDRKVVALICNGHNGHSKPQVDYKGIDDCWAALLVTDTIKSCVFACLGLGSCVRVCSFGALQVKDGIVAVDEEKCKGCGICVSACPKELLRLIPANTRVLVTCSNEDRGADARKACAVACIGCMKCEKVCQDEAIHVENFLARIDYDKCSACGKCVDACPTHSIVMKGGRIYAAA